jgi:type VI secretion system protein ImpL
VTVPVKLRIISNAQAPGAGGSEPGGSQGLRNLRLPSSVVGTSPESSAQTQPGAPQ